MDKNLQLVRQAVGTNGWFTVIDMLFHMAEAEGRKELAQNLDRVNTDLGREIERLGGTPDYAR